MEYVLIFIVISVCIISYYFTNDKIAELKRDGIRTMATIIENHETNPKSMYRLGGNINTPTVRFFTTDGREIIGKPVLGFITQFEVTVPMHIDIIYDPADPDIFCIDA